MIWERVLRMLRLHQVPLPGPERNPDLAQAQQQAEQLHRKAEKVLDAYAAAERQRLANGHRP